MNRIILGKEARQIIKKGVDAVADVVKLTYGAKGSNIILGRPSMLPFITKDGVTVAKEALLDDDLENLGAFLIKQVASKTDDGVKDGTTTSSILAQAIVNEASVKTEDEGVNPIYLKRGIDKATEIAIKELKKLSRKVTNNSILKNVATISANGDKQIGKLISDVYKNTGKDGVIKVEEGFSTDTIVEYVNGYEIDSPFLNWEFINNHEKFQVEFEDCYVLLYEDNLETISDLDATIQAIADLNTNKIPPLLIISDNIDSLVLNKLLGFNRMGKQIMAIKSPSFGARRTEVMKDIASIIGAKVYSKTYGDSLDKVTLEGLGKVKKFITTADKTTLIGGEGKEKDQRIEVVKNQIEATKAKKEKDFVKERLAKLKGGVAVIHVGGYSPVEVKEKMDRVDDALGATRASLEEGFVAGGGVTYLYLSEHLKTFNFENSDEQVGLEILINALQYPFKQILENAQIPHEDYLKNITSGIYGFGVNVDTEKFVDLFKEGIIDPTKVTRMALENSASIASTFLSTGGIVWRDEQVMNSKNEF
jgi:chaperonin GroEL